MNVDTIAAIATPPGKGGVGIVRISGARVPTIAQALLGLIPTPRTANLSTFRDANGGLIDQGIALFFPAPRSFTGETVLELQGHGGPVVMETLLRRCFDLGARPARPGEFTERAFLNGKIDLLQAEAVADLIESSTALGARLAGRSLEGAFSRQIEAASEAIMRLRSLVEATLDFPEEEIDLISESTVREDLNHTRSMIQGIVSNAHQGQIIREGLVVVIAGPPNVGKSSLLNAMSGADAAIVTPIPGTTRDLVKVDIEIDGLPIRIVDTAGMRKSEDTVEQEGIRRAKEQIWMADCVLLVSDGTLEGAFKLGKTVRPDCPVVKVRNKIDLTHDSASVRQTGEHLEISVSAVTGEGIDLLKRHLRDNNGLQKDLEGIFYARPRHLDALAQVLLHLEAASENLETRQGIELVAEELALSQRFLGEMTGQVTSDDLLGQIFSSFCIGK